MSLQGLDPVPTLIGRTRNELSATFDASRPIRVARAPGRLDVMGGIADYTGSLVLEMPLGVACGVALQERGDRRVGVFSFNLLDAHLPFRFEMPLDGLARATAETLRKELAEPGRRWAGYVVGCLFLLHEKGLIDLADPGHKGMNFAVYSTVPEGGGVSSSAALEVATMTALAGHFGLELDGVKVAVLCQEVENRVVGAPCGLMDQMASSIGESGAMMRMRCQPHDLLPPLRFPDGVRAVGVNTNVKHSVGGGAYGRTRTAAFMAHATILSHMRRLGESAGKMMTSDPTGGYLANLEPDDYKRFFRPELPETMTGREFLDRFESHGDPVTTVQPNVSYPVQAACDHHVLDAQRVRRFADFLERIDEHGREKALRSAGHLMYASHKSYGNNAGLGASEADTIVDLVKQRESAGLYGARITGGGSGGTVAVLMDDTPAATDALDEIAAAYKERTGLTPDLLDSTSPGASHLGSEVLNF